MEENSALDLAIDACADRLAFLNENFSALATDNTRRGVELWRQYRTRSPIRPSTGDEDAIGGKEEVDLKPIIIELLTNNSFEDVQDILVGEYSTEMSLPDMVQLIGKQEYLIALKRELGELLRNAVSFEQVATLWNDLERPALGNTTWNAGSISLLAN